MKSLILVLSLTSLNALAETAIYETNRIGDIQYHKDHLVIKNDGKIVTVDSTGNTQYHKQQYKVVEGKIRPIDSTGKVQYHKPAAIVTSKSK